MTKVASKITDVKALAEPIIRQLEALQRGIGKIWLKAEGNDEARAQIERAENGVNEAVRD